MPRWWWNPRARYAEAVCSAFFDLVSSGKLSGSRVMRRGHVAFIRLGLEASVAMEQPRVAGEALELASSAGCAPGPAIGIEHWAALRDGHLWSEASYVAWRKPDALAPVGEDP